MTYKELFAVTDLLNDIREGREIKINNNTRVDLMETENYFKNLISDINKKKVKSKESVMYYRLAIEVNKWRGANKIMWCWIILGIMFIAIAIVRSKLPKKYK